MVMGRPFAVAKTLPLFTSAKRKTLQTLCLRRFEGDRWVRIPGNFTATDLPDRNAVRVRFGGGRYEVIGHDGRIIAARTRFVVQGSPKPIRARDEDDGARAPSSARAFASPEGEREALVFSLLDRGMDLVDITQHTGIRSIVVREIFEQWRTPLATDDVIESRTRHLAQVRSRGLSNEWVESWKPQSKSQAK
jgi:hypothetical protein